MADAFPTGPVTLDTIAADLEHTCPRCGQAVRERFYGPCTACRAQMATAWAAADGVGEVTNERFEPKMNVVPNQVATKD